MCKNIVFSRSTGSYTPSASLIDTIEVTIYEGDPVKYEDAIKDLPEGAKVTLVGNPIDNKKIAKQKTQVKITFKNGTTRTVDVIFNVLERADIPVITPSEETPASPGKTPQKPVKKGVPTGDAGLETEAMGLLVGASALLYALRKKEEDEE